MLAIKLLDAVTADTVGEGMNQTGGLYQVVVEGDMGGGTVTLQTQHDPNLNTWQDVYAEGVLVEINATKNAVITLTISPTLYIRATLAGSTGANCSVKMV